MFILLSERSINILFGIIFCVPGGPIITGKTQLSAGVSEHWQSLESESVYRCRDSDGIIIVISSLSDSESGNFRVRLAAA